MSESSPHPVTTLLREWRAGDSEASARLMPLVYEELRARARGYLERERGNHTLQATALVHEAYLRLVKSDPIAWQNRAHFFCVAARVMRRILVDHARARQSNKRGGEAERVSLELVPEPAAAGQNVEFVALDGALEELAREHPRPARVVELRFFGGLEAREIAEVLELSEKTVLRDWSFAKLWLYRYLAGDSNAVA